MLNQLHADKVTEQGARSSVVNGPFTGTKERRSFKPKVASSILVGRIPVPSVQWRFLASGKPNSSP
jgi:hypothetical protein